MSARPLDHYELSPAEKALRAEIYKRHAEEVIRDLLDVRRRLLRAHCGVDIVGGHLTMEDGKISLVLALAPVTEEPGA
jgi:hypothetical protein